MALLKKEYGKLAPRCWYRVIKKLRADHLGPSAPTCPEPIAYFEGSEYKPKPVDNPLSGIQTLERAAELAGIDLYPCPEIAGAFPPKLNGWRDAWRYLSQVDNPSPKLTKLRDWLWEHDAAPDKPAIPPWRDTALQNE